MMLATTYLDDVHGGRNDLHVVMMLHRSYTLMMMMIVGCTIRPRLGSESMREHDLDRGDDPMPPLIDIVAKTI